MQQINQSFFYTIEKAIKVYRQGLDVSKKISDLKTEGELSEALMLLGADEDINWP